MIYYQVLLAAIKAMYSIADRYWVDRYSSLSQLNQLNIRRIVLEVLVIPPPEVLQDASIVDSRFSWHIQTTGKRLHNPRRFFFDAVNWQHRQQPMNKARCVRPLAASKTTESIEPVESIKCSQRCKTPHIIGE